MPHIAVPRVAAAGVQEETQEWEMERSKSRHLLSCLLGSLNKQPNNKSTVAANFLTFPFPEVMLNQVLHKATAEGS